MRDSYAMSPKPGLVDAIRERVRAEGLTPQEVRERTQLTRERVEFVFDEAVLGQPISIVTCAVEFGIPVSEHDPWALKDPYGGYGDASRRWELELGVIGESY